MQNVKVDHLVPTPCAASRPARTHTHVHMHTGARESADAAVSTDASVYWCPVRAWLFFTFLPNLSPLVISVAGHDSYSASKKANVKKTEHLPQEFFFQRP